jgi:hypothetical protein
MCETCVKADRLIWRPLGYEEEPRTLTCRRAGVESSIILIIGPLCHGVLSVKRRYRASSKSQLGNLTLCMVR